MKPAEAVAFALIKQHCGVLKNSIIPWQESRSPCVADTFTVHGFFSDGATVRLALDVVNACCACEELHPVTNPRFWQRVVRDLWFERGSLDDFAPSSFDFPPFTEQSFASFGVCCNRPAAERIAFWRGFFYADNSSSVLQCLVSWRLVLAALRPHMTSTPRQLMIKTYVNGLSMGWYYDKRIPVLREGGSRDRLVLQTLVQLASYPQSPVDLELTIHHGVNTPRPLQLRDASDVALAVHGGPHVAVECVSLFAMHYEPSARAVRGQVAALGALLRVAFLQGRTKSLLLQCTNDSDLRLVGAMLSIVPSARTLESLNFDSFVCTDSNRLLRLAWIVYATHHPRRPQGLALQLTVANHSLNQSEMQYVQELLRSHMPLRDVVFAVLEKCSAHGPNVHVDVDCFSLGSTATIRAVTLVYCEPDRPSVESAVAILTQDERLDIVARIDGHRSVGVVYPGYGLVWVDEASVTSVAVVNDPSTSTGEEDTKLHNGATLRVNQQGEAAALSSLTIRVEQSKAGPAPTATLEILALYLSSSVRSLDFGCVKIPRDSLQNIVDTSRQLQSLTLHMCLVESVSPLVDAYASARGGCRLSALSLLHVTFSPPPHTAQSFAPIFVALAQPTHPLAVALRELHVDLSRSSTNTDLADLELFLRALEQPRVRLRRVTAVLSYAIKNSRALYARLKRLRGRVLSDPPPAVILATLSVLRVRAPTVRDEAIARTVLWFVGGTMKQSLGWSMGSF